MSLAMSWLIPRFGPIALKQTLGAIMKILVRSANNSTTGEHTSRPARIFRVAAMAIALLASNSIGCNLVSNVGDGFRYSETWNNTASKFRNRSMSSRNWHRHKNRYCNEPCMTDFAEGYRKGYEDVAYGVSNGCTPSFPPRDYWGWQYQSAEGQKKVSAWFAGYPHGARAAEEEGVGSWSQIQMSSNLQAQFVTAGMLPNNGHAVYPITEIQSATPGSPTPAGAPAGQPNNQSRNNGGGANGRQGSPVPMTAGAQPNSFSPGR